MPGKAEELPHHNCRHSPSYSYTRAGVSSPQETLAIPSPGQRVKQGFGFYALNPLSLLHHLNKGISSFLRFFFFFKKKELGHRAEPLNMGGSGVANLLAEDARAHLTS